MSGIDGARRILGGGGRICGPRGIGSSPPLLHVAYAGAVPRSPANVLIELPDGRRVVVPRQRWRFLKVKG